jgi:hypothetical protein
VTQLLGSPVFGDSICAERIRCHGRVNRWQYEIAVERAGWDNDVMPCA